MYNLIERGVFMICKNCNREIPNDSEYCSFCGNVAESVISLNSALGLKKGYTYLELKQWNDAEQFFRAAIINDENTAEAYIGKMLARYKADSIENLAASGKKFISDDDFKLALKYADGEYAEYLKKCALSVAKKSKKITIIVSSICAFVMVVALLSYFVLIPLNRISNYENLLADGKVQKAVKSYHSSKWFEYDQKAKELFYESGLKLVEVKDYKNAEICFEITNGCTDNEKYLNYCKAQNLLANDDLESYNYFTELGDFLDSKEILNTNKYFVVINKLQGKWKYPETSLSVIDEHMINKGYKVNYSENKYFTKVTDSISFGVKRTEANEKTIEIDGLIVNGDIAGKLAIHLTNNEIGILGVDDWILFEILEDKNMCINEIGEGIYPFIEWEKIE